MRSADTDRAARWDEDMRRADIELRAIAARARRHATRLAPTSDVLCDLADVDRLVVALEACRADIGEEIGRARLRTQAAKSYLQASQLARSSRTPNAAR